MKLILKYLGHFFIGSKQIQKIFAMRFLVYFELSQKALCKIVLDKLSLLKNKIYEGVFEYLKWRETLKEMR